MATKRKSASESQDAIAMLMADHKKVKALFKQFAKLKKDEAGEAEKREVVEQICQELTVHAGIEEEIFYPAVREAIEEPDLMDEALVEHAGVKELIAQLRGMSPDDDLYDAKVTVLGEQVDHHVEEEEGEMFPKAKKAKVDLRDLAAQLAEKKQQIQGEAQSGDARRAGRSGGNSRGAGAALRR